MIDIEEKIEKLLAKAVATDKSEDALRFSQAALNSAHAVLNLDAIGKNSRTDNKGVA